MVALMIERFYPNPLQISLEMIGCLLITMVGMGLYAAGIDFGELQGVGWVMLNAFFAIGDRLLQRMMLAADQDPVDISKTGVTLLNNLLGMVPLLVVAMTLQEYKEIPGAVSSLTTWGVAWVAGSCAVGVGISYSGIWVQSKISATSFLVLVNANKFVIIFIEVFCMHTKTLLPVQILGASITIFASIFYGKARERVEAQHEEEKKEKMSLLGANKA
jgi:hypothetical protein